MDFKAFDYEQLLTLGNALHIAEEVTADFFKFSTAQWRRHPFDVKTLRSLTKEEIRGDVFAMLHRGLLGGERYIPTIRKKDYYLICLQDHHILEAVSRDKAIGLLPLLVYIFTHELVHIVRFGSFLQRFDVRGSKREEEEQRVHNITYEILKGVSLNKLDCVLDAYYGHRICYVSV
ncbi:MAG TPA: hypothetical protein EYP06_04720 [Desulfobacterales bacterium]|nr:hypothetical protein [Desulfobacterales bacterium]